MEPFVRQVVQLALRALPPMFLAERGGFCFKSVPSGTGLAYEGVSRRYTAMVLIGASRLQPALSRPLFAGQSPEDVCGRLVRELQSMSNLGDVAAGAWAAAALGLDCAADAVGRVQQIWRTSTDHPTVEIAWMVTALSTGALAESGRSDLLKSAVARLREAYHPKSKLFSHRPAWKSWPPHRAHVGCFADEIYPILALTRYHARFNDTMALDIAAAAAETICRLQGEQGQWWWHFDVRTGRVLEGFPVYSVHQDAMAPMGLFELAEAGGPDHAREIRLGLEWLRRPAEKDVALVDDTAPAIWRKIGRTEPGKLVRSARAVLSRMHPGLRFGWMDRVFEPSTVDYECRPYHLGWVLDAWADRCEEA